MEEIILTDRAGKCATATKTSFTVWTGARRWHTTEILAFRRGAAVQNGHGPKR